MNDFILRARAPQEDVISKAIAAVEEKLRSAAWAQRAWRPAASVHREPRGSAASAGDAYAGGIVPEAKAYDDFIEQHGATGGWHSDDAATFAQAVRPENPPFAFGHL